MNWAFFWFISSCGFFVAVWFSGNQVVGESEETKVEVANPEDNELIEQVCLMSMRYLLLLYLETSTSLDSLLYSIKRVFCF